MYVIALAHLYAWTGEKTRLARHWDTARRILDWARAYGDADGDGYLEYRTKSTKGTKNQGWKDSGNAILYQDGSPVPPPIATCELQGYWFAAQQLMAVLSWIMGERRVTMMRFARLLIVFALLTPLATIYAECAWVFWMEVSGPRTDERSAGPLLGWKTRDDCE